MKVCDVISLNPKQATFPFVLSTGWRQSISRLKETAAGVDHDPAGNASRPKRRRPRSVSGKNWNDNRADFRCQSVQVKPFPFHHTEHIRRRPVVAQRSQDSLSKSLQCFKGSCFMGKKKKLHSGCIFPSPSFFHPAWWWDSLMWPSSPHSVTPEPEKKLFCLAASNFSPTIPPPTPASSLLHLLHLLQSWPSYAPGVVSTSWCCST